MITFENIIDGNPNVDCFGEMNFTNLLTHETAVLSLQKMANNKKQINGSI